MDNKAKKQRFYTLMLVPHDARGKPVSIKIPASWVYATAVLSFFFLVVVGSSIIYSTLLSRRLVNYANTIDKNRQQQAVITTFSTKTNKVARALDELVARDNELRKLLGLKGWKMKTTLSSDKSTLEVTSNKVSLQFEKFDDKITERKRSLEELKQWVSLVQSRFASTPSSWPIYGRLASLFGYRSSPWRGFHAGIDISARYGAPARATANGVVSYIGWRSGYGKTVEINHGHGVSTLYAHNSSYAVRVGQRVKKGQVVSYVGMTGWTTGPHLHYEVRRWGTPLNPVAYLDLNILSASKLWR
ncbi:MAG: M23 family metallopeptidase [Candidatus Margulisbacteria bacterium]|nr:M23 family metallopeptidase [Candidatus Margulisiibacteriota bacterium]